MTEQTTSPAGWYPDDSGRLQWWDGSRWTGAYADEQPRPIANKRNHLLGGMLGLLVTLGLALAELAWLGRADRLAGFLGGMIGPLLGCAVGLTIGLNRKRRKQPKQRPLWWHTLFSAVVSFGWMVLVPTMAGGLDSDVVVPAIVLGAVGTVALVGATKIMTPEIIRD
ncbi:hypothetical protein ASE12_00440 [Aeromicrobium sp. Root236]|uniref:DUF2510 domain-containing protein n=1 Tax=Aeromicrobium sp. Root236 TaxID=1736498 RepID=UPI0006FE3262|nr:DUF2510 domain-containing protein [Aeromicrobium sp. Root236]KRC63357.1 hypothetical protein ASE12_00440 [Aeromicrobium sp. Root236]